MHVFLLFYYYKKAKAAETVKLEKQMEGEDNGRRKLRSPVCNYFEKTEILLFVYFAKLNISTPTIHQTSAK